MSTADANVRQPQSADALPSTPEATALAQVTLERRNDAMYGAVAVVHSYLAAVGAHDWKNADTFWATVPTNPDDASLRSAHGVRSLRIENDKPKVLDKEDPPNAIEVPVRLRASIEGGGQMSYTGWYRVRRIGANSPWQISSASLQPAIK